MIKGKDYISVPKQSERDSTGQIHLHLEVIFHTKYNKTQNE